jgi:hypothetical protein
MLWPKHPDHLLCGVLRVALAYCADADSLSSPAIKPPTRLLVDRTAIGSRQPTFSQQYSGPIDAEKMLVLESQARNHLLPSQFRVLLP